MKNEESKVITRSFGVSKRHAVIIEKLRSRGPGKKKLSRSAVIGSIVGPYLDAVPVDYD